MAKVNDFSGDIDKFILDFEDASEQSVRAGTALTWESIIDIWPVKEGRSRANWFATNKAPSSAVTSKTDKAGVSTKNKAVRTVMNSTDWSVFYLTNNLPYAYVIEMGGYPNPVKLGTRVNKSGTRQNRIKPIYEQFSSGGYSKQAPNGAVRISMQKSKDLIELEAKKRLSKI